MASKAKELSFSEKLAELEAILAWFDDDSTDIDASIKKFERGMVLSTELQSYLEKAENKVQKIKATFDAG